MGRIVKGLTAIGSRGEARANAFFDTGSDWDLVSPELAEKVGDAKLPGGNATVELADGREESIERMAWVALKINGCTIHIAAHVLPGLKHDVVVGNLTMQAHEMNLDMPGEKVHIGRCNLSV